MATITALSARATLAPAWRTHLVALAAVAAFILLLFARDAADIVTIWWVSATYNHCFLIPPLIAWLVAQRRAELAQLTPTLWLLPLIAVAAGAFGWLVGYAAGIGLFRHAALILMLQGATVAILGRTVSRALAFPIFYAVFMVPFGDEAVSAMQTLTAHLTVPLLHLSGIPAHLQGVFITTPVGLFEVAEACAGMRFLIAMLALGMLVANVCFRSWPRRIAFMGLCIVIPVLANGVRAWGTIYLAEQSGIEFATSFDHVLYGGVFFAAVIALIMGLGWPFFDRGVDEPFFDPRALQPEAPAPTAPDRLRRAAGLIGLIALAPLLWATVIAMSGRQDAPASVALPDIPGWTRIDTPAGRPWAPHFAGADHLVTGHYRNQQGEEVTLAIAVFARQEEGRELVGFGQGAVPPTGEWAWTANRPPPPEGRAEMIMSYGEAREVVSFYRVGDSLTGSVMGVKLETLKVRLLGGPQRAVAVLVSAPAGATGASPRPLIDRFLAALGPVDALADRAAGQP